MKDKRYRPGRDGEKTMPGMPKPLPATPEMKMPRPGRPGMPTPLPKPRPGTMPGRSGMPKGEVREALDVSNPRAKALLQMKKMKKKNARGNKQGY